MCVKYTELLITKSRNSLRRHRTNLVITWFLLLAFAKGKPSNSYEFVNDYVGIVIAVDNYDCKVFRNASKTVSTNYFFTDHLKKIAIVKQLTESSQRILALESFPAVVIIFWRFPNFLTYSANFVKLTINSLNFISQHSRGSNIYIGLIYIHIYIHIYIRPCPGHGQKYAKYKMYLSIMIVITSKQHLKLNSWKN